LLRGKARKRCRLDHSAESQSAGRRTDRIGVRRPERLVEVFDHLTALGIDDVCVTAIDEIAEPAKIRILFVIRVRNMLDDDPFGQAGTYPYFHILPGMLLVRFNEHVAIVGSPIGPDAHAAPSSGIDVRLATIAIDHVFPLRRTVLDHSFVVPYTIAAYIVSAITAYIVSLCTRAGASLVSIAQIAVFVPFFGAIVPIQLFRSFVATFILRAFVLDAPTIVLRRTIAM
jgi:hypothetical protein